MNRQAMSFQSGAIKSTSEMFPVGNYFGMHNTGDLVFSGNYSGIINNNPVLSEAGNSSCSSLVLDSVPGLKHDPGLAVEWSVEEQRKLDEGLDKFADEPSVMKYIKIAATLRDKTVRDVALRCRWLTSKRRKPDEHSMGRKVNNHKDKLVELSSKTNIPAVPPNMVPNSLMMHHMDQNESMAYEVSGTGGPMKHLLEQNAQAFDQITDNLSIYKWQDNINIFGQARKNIAAILNDMREIPGIMSEMPPLPECINEDLANESVLEELEMVTAQLTEKTQICFRDALYRLAKKWEHHDMETQEEGGYLDTEKPPPWTLHDIKMRSLLGQLASM